MRNADHLGCVPEPEKQTIQGIHHHIDGRPMEIGSLHELRQIEKRHGVNFPVYGGSMLNVDVENHKNYVDESGVTHRG
jgi:hypothetical protein